MLLPFSELQAHVLIGFSDAFQRVLFFRIENTALFKAQARQLLAALTWTSSVTAAREAGAAAFAAGNPAPPGPAKAGLAFAYRGLAKLANAADMDWLALPRYQASGQLSYQGGVNRSSAFHQDCAARANPILMDPIYSEQEWKVGGLPANQPDGVLIFGGPSRADEVVKRDACLALLGNSVTVVHEDIAEKLPGNREHFGFVDALSQPYIDLQNSENAGRLLNADVGGTQQYHARTLLLLPADLDPDTSEPANMPAWVRCGSFLAFRRLRQNVGAFHQDIERVANVSGRARADVAARVIGRTLAGVPLIQPTQGVDGFNYANDPNGQQCPFSAHIRRGNHRDAANPRPLFRRSLPFGAASPSTLNVPQVDNQERGLMFLSYQASLEKQFEYVSNNWFNSRGGSQAIDALAGRRSGQVQQRDVDLGFRDANGNPIATTLANHIAATGGGYFLALSRAGMANLFV